MATVAAALEANTVTYKKCQMKGFGFFSMRLEAIQGKHSATFWHKDLVYEQAFWFFFMNCGNQIPLSDQNRTTTTPKSWTSTMIFCKETRRLKCCQIFHMEDLRGEIYFSKRQNVSLKNLLVMHKGLLSLWRSIFKEKCWDHFYILITEKDLIKIILDIKIAQRWQMEEGRIAQSSRREVKENV